MQQRTWRIIYHKQVKKDESGIILSGQPSKCSSSIMNELQSQPHSYAF